MIVDESGVFDLLDRVMQAPGWIMVSLYLFGLVTWPLAVLDAVLPAAISNWLTPVWIGGLVAALFGVLAFMGRNGPDGDGE